MVWDAYHEMDVNNPQDLLLTCGLFPHFGDYCPRLDTQGQVRWHWEEVDDSDQLVSGEIFQDGSCSRHVASELNRAVWDCSILPEVGRFPGRFFGIIYGTFS